MIPGIVALLCMFAVCAIVMLGKAGVRTLAALILVGAVIVGVSPPLVLRGVSPLLVALPAGVVISVVGLLIIGGFNRKSMSAALGAAAALLFATLLPLMLFGPLQLTGLAAYNAPRADFEVHLWYAPAFARVDFAHLLIAGIVLASLGAIIDVCMTIASSVQQATTSERDVSFGRKFSIGFRVGSKVLGPMLAVMLLVFIGGDVAINVARARVPGSFWDVIRFMNYGSIAAHVLETLTAGLGLLSCIPLTALFAAALGRSSQGDREESDSNCRTQPPIAGSER